MENVSGDLNVNADKLNVDGGEMQDSCGMSACKPKAPACRKKPACPKPRKPACRPKKPACRPKKPACRPRKPACKPACRPKPKCKPRCHRMKPGPVMNNGYLNFLRWYRQHSCNMKPNELVIKGAKLWCAMSPEKKARFERMACMTTQSPRHKSTCFCKLVKCRQKEVNKRKRNACSKPKPKCG